MATLATLAVGAAPAWAAVDLTAPAPVKGMTTSADKTRVKLDWTNSTESDLAGYLVYRADSPDGTYSRLTAAPRTSSDFPDYTARVGFPSYYRVTAVDKSGNESAPVEVSNTRKDGVKPVAVKALTGTRTDEGIVLDWADNTEADLAGYTVARATTSGGTYTKLTSKPIGDSTFLDSTAAAGRAYYYRVTAVDLSGNVSATTSLAVLPKDTTAPKAVAGMKVTNSTTNVKLDWSSNTESDLAGYLVYRSSSADGEYTRLTATPRTSSDYTDATAPIGVTSYYQVTAVDKSGNESAPVAATGVRKDGTAPTAVRTLTGSRAEEGVVLDWADNTEADLAGYVVSRATSSGGTYTKLTATPVATSTYTDTTAAAGTAYYYKVVAVDTSGNTSSAVTLAVLPPDTAAPKAVAGMVVSADTSRVKLDWTSNTESDLAGYHVYRASSPDGEYTRLTATPRTSSDYSDIAAPVGVTSYYRVTAVDKTGNESAPVAASGVRRDGTAPAAVQDLSAAAAAEGVVLDWADSAESDLAGYRVSRATDALGPFTALTDQPLTESRFADDTAPDGPVYYRVTAVDLSGNVSAVASASWIPVDTSAPGAPVGLTARGTGAGVELDWADSAEGDLEGYLVYRADSATGRFTKLTGAPVTVSEYADASAVAGEPAFYRVTAVDTAGNESEAATADAIRTVEKAPVAGADLTVAQDGSGDYRTIADAVAAAPSSATTPYVIAVRPGTYRELLTVAKPNLTLVGATGNAADVVISYDNAAGTPKPDGSGTYGTSGSATVLIKANNVTTKDLTIENSFDEAASNLASEQAVALKTTGDRLVFDNVRLLGDQDTLYADSPAAGAVARSYYVDSYIEGDVDFVFGRGTAVFDRSTLHASSRGSSSNNGYVVAPSTDKSLAYGFLITDSRITSDAPAGTFSLGRPWQPSGDVNAVAQTVVRDTELPAAIKSSPWSEMSGFSWRDARFFEYHNTGAGAGVNADRPQLSDLQAATTHKWAYLAGKDGWNPTGQDAPPPPADTTAPAAPTALTAEAGDSSVTLSWRAAAESDLAGYRVYRSTGSTVALTAANRVGGELTGTSYTDRTAANGTAYTYVVTAVDSTGNESVASDPTTATAVGVPLPAHDLLVAADGTGQYTTVQAAIDAAPAGTAAKPTVIAVKPGIYKEMMTVSKSYLTLIGTTGNATDVVLTYDNAAGTTIPGSSATYGTGKSQSVLVSGSNVTVKDLTIENSFDEAAVTLAGGEQAVALKTTGDRLVFDNVRLLGNQDTLLVDSPDAPVVARSYFVNSYIEGDVDFIFGRGTAVFDRTTIHALSRGSSSNNGYITAASTSDKNPYGFLIINSTITSNAPAGTFSLGRPWRGWTDGYSKNGVTYNSRGQVTIRNTTLPAAIRTTQPWADMSPNLWTDGRFSEYANTGAGATLNTNRPQLTDDQATDATPQHYLTGTDGWNPTH